MGHKHLISHSELVVVKTGLPCGRKMSQQRQQQGPMPCVILFVSLATKCPTQYTSYLKKYPHTYDIPAQPRLGWLFINTFRQKGSFGMAENQVHRCYGNSSTHYCRRQQWRSCARNTWQHFTELSLSNIPHLNFLDYYAFVPIGGDIKRCFCLTSDVCLTSVCLSVCLSRTSGLTREQRGRGRLKLVQW